jgi:hypothetical protein
LVGAGQIVGELGAKLKQARDNSDVARGTAEYNNTINAFNETLPTLDPDEYVAEYSKLEERINKIPEGMSSDATQQLKNKFLVWNEVNRASTATLAIKQKSAQAKQEIPIRLANFIANDQIEEANEYIEGYGESVLSPGEVELWKKNIVGMKNEYDMWQGINLAVELQTPEAIAEAEKMIRETNKTDPEEQFRTMNTFRAQMGAKKKEQTEARKALVNTEANNVLATVFDGDAYQGNVTPENQQLVTMINSRVANGNLDESDGITYNFMEQQVLAGEFFTEREIMEGVAGTEVGGMSQQEAEDLVKLNNQNEKLTVDQKDSLVSFTTETDIQYDELKGIASLKLSDTLKARVFGAIEEDKRAFKKQLKQMVLAGESSETIGLAIQANFIADSRKYVKGGFKRLFNAGVNDFTDVVLGTTDREKENEIILDLLKSGAVEGTLVDNIEDLFERFNQ